MKYQQSVVMPASVQDWLDHELEVRGIDAVVYTRYILSILQQDNELVDTELFSGVAKRNPQESPRGKEKSKLSADRLKLLNCQEMKRSAAIECLMSVSEQKCGIEKLVDELCDKLKTIQNKGSLSTELEVKDSQGTQSNMIDIRSLASSSPKEEAGNLYPTFSGASGNVEPSVEPKSQISDKNARELNEEQTKIGKQLSEEKDKMQNDRNEMNEEIKKKEAEDKLNFIMRCIPFNLMHSKSGDVILDNWQPCTNKLMPSWYLDEKRFAQFEPIGYNNNNVYKNGKPELIVNENSSMQNSYIDLAAGNAQEKENNNVEFDIDETENAKEEKVDEDETEAEALGEAELLAKLTAKFNDDVASIWSDQRNQPVEELGKGSENIWQMLPFYRPDYNLSSGSRCAQLETNSGRKFVWPRVAAAEGIICNEDGADDSAYRVHKGTFASACSTNPCEVNPEMSDYKRWNRSLYSSFANLEIDCSSPQEKDKVEVEKCSPAPRQEEEMQFIWQMLDSAVESEQATCVNNEDDLGFLENYQRFNQAYNNEWHQLKNNSDIALYLQTVWDSSALQREMNSLPYAPFNNSSSESLVANDYWQSDDGSIESVMALTRSYDSYLNKINRSEVTDCATSAAPPEVEALSEPTLSPKNCTLTYHKGESCFVEVKPSSRSNWESGVGAAAAQLAVQKQFAQTQLPQTDYESEDNSENLLTSPKTHFRPIRQDSCETDTTVSSDDSALAGSQTADEQTAAVNSKSISPIFINCRPPDEDSSDESNFIPQISKSNKEKFCQTDDTGGGDAAHRSEATETEPGRDDEPSIVGDDSCTGMLHAVIDVLHNMLYERGGTDGEEISNTTTESNSSSSVSPPSSRDEPSDLAGRMAAADSPFSGSMYKKGLWNDLRAPQGACSMLKWSTAQEENEEQRCWDDRSNEALWTNTGAGADADNVGSAAPCSEADKIKALRDEIRDEEEKLFDDINFLRELNLEDEYENVCAIGRDQWVGGEAVAAKKSAADAPEEEECNLELERIHCNLRTYSSSDGDEIAGPDNVAYSDYFGDLQTQDSFSSCKLPLLPSSKVLYSTDLEEEWKKDLFDPQIPKSRAKQKNGNLKRPCSFYMEGNCRRTDCKFSHDLASITCRFWLEGSCFKGVTCPFLHGFQKAKEDNEEKADFTLELQSEAHFPALSKPKTCPRRKDFIQSSSSDSTPVAKNKRQRKRFSAKERRSSPNSLPKHCKTSRQTEKSKRPLKSSSSEDDLMEV